MSIRHPMGVRHPTISFRNAYNVKTINGTTGFKKR